MFRQGIGWVLTGLGAFLGLVLSGRALCLGQHPVVLGAVERVRVLPWDVTFEARVDTGAAKSSLAATELRVIGREVEFRFPGAHLGDKVRLPVVRWVEVRTNLGREKRPLVQLEICVGGQRFHTLVNLDDRSGLKYPMLLGRETLRGRFLVDVGSTHLHPEPCGHDKVVESPVPRPEGPEMP